MDFKKFLTGKNITQEKYDAMSEADKAALFIEYQEAALKAISDAVEKKADKTDIPEAVDVSKAIKDEFEAEFKDVYSPAELKTKMDEIDEAVKVLKDGKDGGPAEKTLVKELKTNKQLIRDIAEGKAGEVIMKTLVTRSSIATNVVSGFILPDIGKLGVKERSLYNVLPKIMLPANDNSGGVIKYRDWDEGTIARAADMVAEGAAFPESTAAFKDYTLDIRKCGDTLPVTEEFFEDEQLAASELEMFVVTNVDTDVDDQLVNGDNTGQNLKGLITSVGAYTPDASGISAPNLKDLAIKVRNDITRSRGSKYKPDMVVVASSTMEDLVLAKDDNNNYIFDEDTGTLGGMSVVVDENMADNQMVVGDRKFARIYEKTGTVVSRGYVGDQFKEDEMTIKVRKRLALLIRTVDATGFRKVTDVDAALTTLGS